MKTLKLTKNEKKLCSNNVFQKLVIKNLNNHLTDYIRHFFIVPSSPSPPQNNHTFCFESFEKIKIIATPFKVILEISTPNRDVRSG